MTDPPAAPSHPLRKAYPAEIPLPRASPTRIRPVRHPLLFTRRMGLVVAFSEVELLPCMGLGRVGFMRPPSILEPK